jgi:acetyl-CoA synthetase
MARAMLAHTTVWPGPDCDRTARTAAAPARPNVRQNTQGFPIEEEAMSTGNTTAIGDLLAERELSSDEVLRQAEARLDWPITKGLNSAHESCDRWAGEPARVALIECQPDGRSRRWTFAELADASSRLATAWRSAGVRRGDRVASVLGSRAEAYIGALAAWRSGIVYQPLFAGFGPAGLAERIKSSQPAAVLVGPPLRDRLTAAFAMAGCDPLVYTVADADGSGCLPGDRSFWTAINTNAPNSPVVVTAPTDTATLLYTSGTTGAPKGCLMPHSTVLSLQPFVRHVLALESSDILFCGAGPGWAYGLYALGFAVMALGHPVMIYTGKFDPAKWLAVIAEQRPTVLAAAPSAIRRLASAAQGGGVPDSLRSATCAGEPLDAALAQRWRELAGFDLRDSFGQSELAMVLGNLAHGDTPVTAGALASAVPGLDVALVDEHGIPQSTQGILAVRKPKYQTCTGYRNQHDIWAGRWRGEYFLSGDIFRRDEQGRYRFVGRQDDLIVTSGYNVGPSEVEDILLAHRGVAEAAVVPAPDPDRGSVVRAVIVLNGLSPGEVVAEDVRQMIAETLGRHAAPQIIDFVDALPRNETGKVKRDELRTVCR